MADLASGRYPDTNIDWLLDGKPDQPFRANFPRWVPLATAGLTATSGTAWVVPVAVQQGDVIKSVTVGVKTASGTPTHGWAALYTGVTTADTLIVQSADDTSGFHGSGAAQTFTLTAPHSVGADPGKTGTDGPLVLGVMLYVEATTGGVLDGAAVGSEAVAGSVYVTGQVPLLSSLAGQAFHAAAPADLTGFTAAAAGFTVPLVILH